MEQSNRLEALRHATSSIMIKATPNSVRWDEVNQVKYRFQALNFHSDAVDALVENSPPITRRARASTSPVKKQMTCSSSDDQEGKLCHSRIRSIQRSTSVDFSSNKNNEYLQKNRKGSVVQISKDDTSDYNSDEEVFTDTSNTTLYHIENRQIKDRTEIRITRSPSFEQTMKNSESRNSVHIENDEEVLNLSKEELETKSKRELIGIIRHLQLKIKADTDPQITFKSVSSLIKDFQNQINSNYDEPPFNTNEEKVTSTLANLSSVNEDNTIEE